MMCDRLAYDVCQRRVTWHALNLLRFFPQLTFLSEQACPAAIFPSSSKHLPIKDTPCALAPVPHHLIDCLLLSSWARKLRAVSLACLQQTRSRPASACSDLHSKPGNRAASLNGTTRRHTLCRRSAAATICSSRAARATPPASCRAWPLRDAAA